MIRIRARFPLPPFRFTLGGPRTVPSRTWCVSVSVSFAFRMVSRKYNLRNCNPQSLYSASHSAMMVASVVGVAGPCHLLVGGIPYRSRAIHRAQVPRSLLEMKKERRHTIFFVVFFFLGHSPPPPSSLLQNTVIVMRGAARVEGIK